MAAIQTTLKLIDLVSKDATNIASALKKIDTEAKRVQKSLGLTGLDKKLKSSYLNGVIKDLKEANGMLEKKPSTSWQYSAIIAGEIIKDAFEQAGRLLFQGVKIATDYLAQAEQTELGLRFQAPEAREFIKLDVGAYAGITGQGQEQIKQQLLPLLQSGFSDSQARQIREAASDLSVFLGHGVKDTEEFIDVFRRINLREGLQARQLLRIGIQEKVFYTKLGKNLGVSEAAAKQAAAKGKAADAIRDTLLQIVAEKNKAATGQYKTGPATKLFSESLAGRLQRFKTLPEDLVAALRGTTALKKIEDTLGRIYDWIFKNKELIAGSFNRVLEKIADILPKVFDEKNIDKFVGGIDKIADGVGWIIDHADGLLKIFETISVVLLGIAGARVFEGIGLALANAISGVAALTTGFKVVAGVVAGLGATVLSVAAALGSWAIALYRIGKTGSEIYGGKGFIHGVESFWDDLKFKVAGKSAIATDNPGFAAMQAENQRRLALRNNISSPDQTFSQGIQTPAFKPTQAGKAINFSPQINYHIEGMSNADELNHTLQQHSQELNDLMSRQLEQSLQQSSGG